jgi:hypothetical protein
MPVLCRAKRRCGGAKVKTAVFCGWLNRYNVIPNHMVKMMLQRTQSDSDMAGCGGN